MMYHKLSGIRQELIPSNFSKLETWNNCVNMAMCPPKFLGKNTPLLILAYSGCWKFLAFLGLWQHSSNLCLHHHIFLLCVSVSNFLFFYKGPSHEIKNHPSPVWPHLNLVTSAKTLLPNKVMFKGSKWTRTWGSEGCHSTQHNNL